MTEHVIRLACLGFGEAARAFTAGWHGRGDVSIAAYDVKTDAPGAAADAMRAAYANANIDGRNALEDALGGASVVLSLVTADQALIAARRAAAHLEPGALFLDGNSCAPQDKIAAAKAVETAGGRYADVAVMASAPVSGHRTPLLISGPHSSAALELAEVLDMRATIAEGPVGRASSIKLTRSIIVKGLEALMAESLAAGGAADVVEPVLASLEASHPGLDWRALATVGQADMVRHGRRRAAEMEAAAAMVKGHGLPNEMAAATAIWEARKAAGTS